MNAALSRFTDAINFQRFIHRARGHEPVKGDVYGRAGWWCSCGAGWRKW